MESKWNWQITWDEYTHCEKSYNKILHGDKNKRDITESCKHEINQNSTDIVE
jgi:hypothetical protein